MPQAKEKPAQKGQQQSGLNQKDFAEYLSRAEEAWKLSENQYEVRFGGKKVPMGVYGGKLQQASLRMSSNKNPFVSRTHIITEGEQSGCPVDDMLMLRDERDFVRLRHWFSMIGKTIPDSLKDLPDIIKKINEEKPICRFELSYNNDWVNVTVVEGTIEGSSQVEGSTGDPTLDSAVNLCNAYGIQISDGDTIDEIKVKLSEYEWDASKIDASEVSVLQEIGIEVLNAPPKPKAVLPQKKSTEPSKVPEPPQSPVKAVKAVKQGKANSTILADTKDFCTRNEIEVGVKDDLEILKERIDSFTYPRTSLSAEDIQLLTALGLDKDITE